MIIYMKNNQIYLKKNQHPKRIKYFLPKKVKRVSLIMRIY